MRENINVLKEYMLGLNGRNKALGSWSLSLAKYSDAYLSKRVHPEWKTVYEILIVASKVMKGGSINTSS